MVAKDYADLFFSIRQNVYFYWNFFIIVSIAAIGWITSWQIPPILITKLSLSLGILTITIICLMSQLLNYSLVEAARKDWVEIGKIEENDGHLIKKIRSLSYVRHKVLIWGVHLLLGLGIFCYIWFF